MGKEAEHGKVYTTDDMEHFGSSHCEKMYVDPDARHVGYVIAGRWLRVYEVHEWEKSR